MKKVEFEKLIKDLGKCRKCTDLKCRKKSLINIYQDYEFCTNIPSIWTDWFNRLDAEIMIIGQDWGPYEDMRKFNKLLDSDKSNWRELIESEKSSTKKLLANYIRESSGGSYSLDKIFVTNAIMCARQGDSYRGDNIDLKRSTCNCSEFLRRQIEIVKPKVILTLGYYPLLSLAQSLGFKIENTLSLSVEKYPEIKVGDYVIIPLYHPVAQIKKSVQIAQYKRIWKYVGEG